MLAAMTSALLTSGLFGQAYGDAEIARAYSALSVLGRMLDVERAWTAALTATDAVAAEDGAAARAALARFDPVRFEPDTDRDGVPVPSLVAALRAGLAPGPAAAIHSGLTSQDVIDTALVLVSLEVLDLLATRTGRVLAALADLTRRHGDAALMARTRMQAARPATAALRLGAWERGLRAQHDRRAAVRSELAQVQIGGAVGLRDAPEGRAEAAAAHAAAALGLRAGPVWHTDRAPFVAFGHWLTLLCGALGKLGQDVALMAQQGVDEIALAGGGGSSAMPHKRNPVRAEALVALARHVAGLQGTLAQAMLHEQERSGAAWALEWLTLPVMAECTGAALTHAEALLGQITRVGRSGERDHRSG